MIRKNKKPVFDSIDEAFKHPDVLEELMSISAQKALLEHKRAGNPVCVWRNGGVVWIPAEEIPENIVEMAEERRRKS